MIESLNHLPYFHLIITVLLGAVLGSFATAIAHRSVSEQTWGAQLGLKSRSRCLSCAAPLTAIDLMPILSWIILRGKCRICSAPISIWYLVIEFVSVAMCLGIFMVYGLTLTSVIMMLAVPFLLALLVVDFKHMILPDILVLLFALLGVVAVSVSGDAVSMFNALLSGAIYGAILWGFGFITSKVLKKDALGFGDVKYFTAAGIWLGLYSLGNIMILSGILGLVFAIGWRIIKKEDYFPFGPALIVSTYILFLING